NQLICEGVIYDNPCTLRQYYATLPPGAVRKLTMKATFDENATNIYKGLIAEYDWIFDAKVVKGSIEDPNKPNEPFVPEPNQPQTERPLAPNVQGVVKPLPNTGMYTIELLTFGIVLLVTSVIVLKKKGEREDETNKKN
ncbi:MAG: LPXTG cell wall anchor domain-containing protein, partial [Culicoidibacterales bacterium]